MPTIKLVLRFAAPCCIRSNQYPQCNGVLKIDSIVLQMLPSKAMSPVDNKGAGKSGSSVVPAQLYVVAHLTGVDACETGTPPEQNPLEVLGSMLLLLM